VRLNIGRFAEANTKTELKKALAFTNPEAILEIDEDGIYYIVSDGVALGFVGKWVSEPILVTSDLEKLASAIEFANPAADCTVSRFRVTVRCDRSVKLVAEEVMVIGRHPLVLPEGFISMGTRDVQFPDDPVEASLMFYALLDECIALRVGVLLQNVPSVIAGAIAWMHNRVECPTVLATINGNRAPIGEKPVFELSKIYNLLTNEVVWKKNNHHHKSFIERISP